MRNRLLAFKKLKIDEAKISAAVSAFENEVDFELVPVLAHQCMKTTHVFWILMAFFQAVFLLTLEVLFMFNKIELSAFEVVQLNIALFPLAFLLSRVLSDRDCVKRFFVSRAEQSKAVEEKAHQLFFQKHIYQTQSHQGLLLLVSLTEKRIVVLPDPMSTLKESHKLSHEVLAIMQSEFKNAHYEEGLLKAIAHLHQVLKVQYPKNTSQNSENQLSNKLIWISD